MKTVKNIFVLTSTMAALLASGNVAAETANSDFYVTIKIKSVCEVNTNSGGAPTESTNPSAGADIDFGEYFSNHSSNVDAASKVGGNNGITLKCTKGVPYKIGLTPKTDNNHNGGGKMNGLGSNSASKIAYTLYQDENRNTVWGDQVDTNTLNGQGQGFTSAINVPVYGRVLASELDKPIGRYSDQVTVTVTY